MDHPATFSHKRKKTNWSVNNSIMLSQITTLLTALCVLALFAYMPMAKPFLATLISAEVIAQYHYLLLTIYVGGSFGLLLLYFLFALVNNMQKQIVFTQQNINYLRYISWLCVVGGLIGIASAFYWIIWLPVGLMALFMFVIVRVIKNIIEQALIIKMENDFTV